MTIPHSIAGRPADRHPMMRQTRRRCPRSATALMMALFIMSVSSATVIYILDTETVQYAAHRNMMAYDRARYLAEAGLQHALAELDADFTWRVGIPTTEFPSGSGNTYSASVTEGTGGTLIVSAEGSTPVSASRSMQRRLEITVKQGG